MNIVYKFVSNKTGKFYIGSKTECKVVDGKIISRDGRTYYTSSIDEGLLDEFAEGNMQLEVLEENIRREDILDREAFYQRKYQAVENPNCYNKIYADFKDIDGKGICFRRTFGRDTHDCYGNIFKETVKEITWRNRSVARRDTKANELGFDNYGELHLWGLKLRSEEGVSFKELDRRLGANGFFKRSLKGQDIRDFDRKDIDILKVKSLLVDGKTLIKICEDLNYPESVVRYMLGGKNIKHVFDTEDKIAIKNGFIDRYHMNNTIMYRYLCNESFSDISKSLDSVSISTVQRIVESVVREKLDPKEFEQTS